MSALDYLRVVSCSILVCGDPLCVGRGPQRVRSVVPTSANVIQRSQHADLRFFPPTNPIDTTNAQDG